MNKEFIKDIEAVATDVSNVVKDGCEITIDPTHDLGTKLEKIIHDAIQAKEDITKTINDAKAKIMEVFSNESK